MNSPQLLSSYERCNRLGIWSRNWERDRIEAKDLLSLGIQAGLTTSRKDFGDSAGECVIGISRDIELIQEDTVDQYGSIINIASLADIVTSAIRKSTDDPWTLPKSVDLGDGVTWNSSALLSPDGRFLRRVALVGSWSKDRHYSTCREWGTLGEIAAYNLPMQIVVVNIGSRRDGKYHSAWTKGFRHPINKGLRFKRRNFIGRGFKESWSEVWREDYDQISTKEWLDGMIKDDVLQDLCFRVDVPALDEENQQRIIDLAKSKLKRIYSTEELPEQQLSTCYFPIPCPHRVHCESGQEPSGRYGFVPIDQLA
jgi:hypothetical protein